LSLIGYQRATPDQPTMSLCRTPSIFSQSTISVVADSGGAGRHLVTAATPTEGSASTPTSSIHDSTHDIKDLRRLFTQVYRKWSRSEPVDEEDMSAITNVHVSEENFLKLTETRELGKYIALIDYHIRFDELPLHPHGQILSYLSDYLSGVFQTTTAANVLFGAADNGMASSILSLRCQTFVSMLVLSSVPIYHIKFDPELFPTPLQLGCDSLRMEYRIRTWWLRLLSITKDLESSRMIVIDISRIRLASVSGSE